MDPLTIATVASLGASALKAGKGVAQAMKAKKLSRIKRPTYKVPESVETAISSAEQAAASTRMAGQAETEARIGEATAAGVGAAKEAGASSSGLLQTISNLVGREQEAKVDVGIAAGQEQRADVSNLEKLLLQKGRYEEQAFKINELDPYLAAKGAESALRQASTENIFGAAFDVLGTGAAALDEKQPPDTKDVLGDTRSDIEREEIISQGLGPLAETSVATADVSPPVTSESEESILSTNLDYYRKLYPLASDEVVADMAKKHSFYGTPIK